MNIIGDIIIITFILFIMYLIQCFRNNQRIKFLTQYKNKYIEFALLDDNIEEDSSKKGSIRRFLNLNKSKLNNISSLYNKKIEVYLDIHKIENAERGVNIVQNFNDKITYIEGCIQDEKYNFLFLENIKRAFKTYTNIISLIYLGLTGSTLMLIMNTIGFIGSLFSITSPFIEWKVVLKEILKLI